MNKKPPYSQKLQWWSVVVLVALAAVIFYIGTQQLRNLEAARKHAQLLTPHLHSNSLFKHIELGTYTGDNGCLLVAGYVEQQTDMDALRNFIESSQPPVPIKFSVIIGSNPRPGMIDVPAN